MSSTKSAIAALAVLTAVLSLSGCAANAEPKAESSAKPSASPTPTTPTEEPEPLPDTSIDKMTDPHPRKISMAEQDFLDYTGLSADPDLTPKWARVHVSMAYTVCNAYYRDGEIADIRQILVEDDFGNVEGVGLYVLSAIEALCPPKNEAQRTKYVDLNDEVGPVDFNAGDAALTPTPKPKPQHHGPKRSFGEGTWLVGQDIKSGTYRANGDGCYWERLSGLSGDFKDILANDNASGPVIVTISPSDRAFNSERCGTWHKIG